MSSHEIKRAQAVTRWVEGVEERGQYRTRDGSLVNNRNDAEYVAEHIKSQAARIAELEEERADSLGKWSQVREQEARIAELEAIVERLPKYADTGEPIPPGSEVWVVTKCHRTGILDIGMAWADMQEVDEPRISGDPDYPTEDGSDWFACRAAAEAALAAAEAAQ